MGTQNLKKVPMGTWVPKWDPRGSSGEGGESPELLEDPVPLLLLLVTVDAHRLIPTAKFQNFGVKIIQSDWNSFEDSLGRTGYKISYQQKTALTLV